LPPAPPGIDQGASEQLLLESAVADQDSMTAWLRFECQAVSGVMSGVLVLGPPDAGPFAPIAFWPPGNNGAPRLVEVAEQALGERRTIIETLPFPPGFKAAGDHSHGVAIPIEIDLRLHGVLAIEASQRSNSDLLHAIQVLQWGCAGVEAHIRRTQNTESQDSQERLITVLDLVASVVEEPKFEAACRSLVTELSLKMECDRVSIGAVHRGSAKVIALSHSAQFGKRMNLINDVGAAMDEAIDQKAVIRFPAHENDEIVVSREHEKLSREHGSGSVLTVPLGGGEFKGALTLERPKTLPFKDTDVELSQSVAALLSRILEIKKLNDRSLAGRTWDAMVEQSHRLLGRRYIKRKLALISVALLAAFFSVATTEYRVTAPATLEGAIRRSLSAPFDGFIATAEARAGDVARANSILATLDDQDLRIERLKWASQYAQYVKQHQEAVANRERAKAQIAEALFEQARAQATLLDEQMVRAAIRAPFDGIVVKGDLSQSLGGAVKRGDVLFELTPLDAYRIIIEVDEAEIIDVAPGRKGTLVLGSISDEVFSFTVKNVTPVTVAKEGRNYFRVEGILDRATDRLRPGMQGVGKIEVEPRKLIWIWTHRLVNWARLFVWTYLP
jgi:multidrug resistance efflux pump